MNVLRFHNGYLSAMKWECSVVMFFVGTRRAQLRCSSQQSPKQNPQKSLDCIKMAVTTADSTFSLCYLRIIATFIIGETKIID